MITVPATVPVSNRLSNQHARREESGNECGKQGTVMATVKTREVSLSCKEESSSDYGKGYSVPSRSSPRITMQPCQVILLFYVVHSG